jgi:Protein of unknown function (DUF2905)
LTRIGIQFRRGVILVKLPLRPCITRSGFTVQRALFALGIIIALVGLAWPWISKLPLGRLPGDFLIERPGFRLFMPFTTMIVISLLITLILMLFRK